MRLRSSPRPKPALTTPGRPSRSATTARQSRSCSWNTQALSSVDSCTMCGPSDSWSLKNVGLDSVSKPQALAREFGPLRSARWAAVCDQLDAVQPEPIERLQQRDLLLVGGGVAGIHGSRRRITASRLSAPATMVIIRLDHDDLFPHPLRSRRAPTPSGARPNSDSGGRWRARWATPPGGAGVPAYLRIVGDLRRRARSRTA